MKDEHEAFLNPYKVLGILDTPRRLNEWLSQKRYPVHVKFDLTGACNLRCIFCSGVKMQASLSPQRIPWVILKTLLPDLAENGCKAVTFTGGGEPLLYPEIEECLELTHQLGLVYGLTTNAALPLSPRLKASMKEASWIRISVNAGSAQTYQVVNNPRHQGKKVYQLVLHNLEKLRRMCSPSTRLGCSFLIEAHNWREILSFAQQIKAIGLDYIQYKLLYISEKQTIYDSPEYREHASGIMQLIDETRSLQNETFKIIFPKDRAEFAEKRYQTCWVQHFFAHVGVDSQVYPCCVHTYHLETALGSLLDHSFRDIWQGAARWEKVNTLGSACPRCWWDRINEVLDALSTPLDDGLFI